jgi:hypothetical protein
MELVDAISTVARDWFDAQQKFIAPKAAQKAQHDVWVTC